jgi:hypothetical protein
VSISIPTEAPSIGKRTDDGPGTTVVGYFKMKESTRTILRRITADGYDSSADNTESGVDAQKQITNGVKLWEEVSHNATLLYFLTILANAGSSYCTVL